MSKSPAYPPLDSLFDLACRDGVDIRPTLLRVITDLYVQKPVHSTEEETQYVELALGLIDSVDAPTRAAVAASLSTYAAAPQAILRKLGAPAQRAETQAKPATSDPAETFFAATPADRRTILANVDVSATPAPRPVPSTSEVVTRLEAAALQRNVGEFSRTLERALGIGRELAERISRDASGEPIIVAAKALGMKAAVLQRILLFLNPAIGHSVERVFRLADLFDELTPQAAEQILAIWRKTSEKTGEKPRPAHQPQYWDDERRSARSLSTPAKHEVARSHEDQSTRFKNRGR